MGRADSRGCPLWVGNRMPGEAEIRSGLQTSGGQTASPKDHASSWPGTGS
jgi:hypothetical protein